jgi:hypothetical protein
MDSKCVSSDRAPVLQAQSFEFKTPVLPKKKRERERERGRTSIWWHRTAVSALKNLRQGDHEFEASPVYIKRLCLKNKNK